MASGEYELSYLRAAVDQLESYLLSKELYWPLRANPPAGKPDYPPLTPGVVLLMLANARARDLDPQQQQELARLEQQVDAARDRWRVAWSRKALQGFHARLILWRNFLEDYRQNPSGNIDRYAYEVRRRVMLELLLPEAVDLPTTDLELLAGLDQLLRTVFISGEFVWDEELQVSFPPQPYWFLYGRLKGD